MFTLQLHRIVSEHELDAYAEAASNRIYTWDKVHLAYREHSTDDNYSYLVNVDPSPGQWIQARPIQLLTTHIPIDEFSEDPDDTDELEEISDEYLEEVQLHMADMITSLNLF